ncbi:MAG: hypothetical protein ACREL7_15950 [Longimicrobiales bacterium]
MGIVSGAGFWGWFLVDESTDERMNGGRGAVLEFLERKTRGGLALSGVLYS